MPQNATLQKVYNKISALATQAKGSGAYTRIAAESKAAANAVLASGTLKRAGMGAAAGFGGGLAYNEYEGDRNSGRLLKAGIAGGLAGAAFGFKGAYARPPAAPAAATAAAAAAKAVGVTPMGPRGRGMASIAMSGIGNRIRNGVSGMFRHAEPGVPSASFDRAARNRIRNHSQGKVLYGARTPKPAPRGPAPVGAFPSLPRAGAGVPMGGYLA